MLILGIDPGSRITGFGIIEVDRPRGAGCRYRASGCIQSPQAELPERLKTLFEELTEVLAHYAPDELAVEQVFMHRNADSALKLGHARGVAICAAAVQGLPIYEYTPREIKQAIVGNGNAAKTQVQYMVRTLLRLPAPPQADAADALAVALCHRHTCQTLERRVRAGGAR